jgi:hypothetical protein
MRNLPVLTFAWSIVALGLVAFAPPQPPPAPPAGLTDADRAAFAGRFARRIWPMMAEPSDPAKGCIACHRDDQSNTSPLVLAGDPSTVFTRLLSDGYFDRGDPSSILSRVAHEDPRDRMPPEPAPPWSKAEVETLRAFVEEMAARRVRKNRD